MSEEEQDEGTRRASELLSLRHVGGQDERFAGLVSDALRAYDALGLVELDSSDEELDWSDGGEATAGGSDEELAWELSRTLSAERGSAAGGQGGGD